MQNGILHVSAKDKAYRQGKQNQKSRPSSGLSDARKSNVMVKDAEAHAEEDHKAWN